MQFLSAGKGSLREKAHACDAGLQAGNCSLAIGAGLVDCLHRQPHSLLVAKGQLARGLEDAVCVNSLYLLGHSTAPQPAYGESAVGATTAFGSARAGKITP